MLDPKKIHEVEQGLQEASEMTARMLWSLYRQFIDTGFSDVQAFLLTRDYLITFVSNQQGDK